MTVVIVTGGAGFIGSHTVELLLEKGYEVVVVDDFSSGRVENLKRVLGKVRLARVDVSKLGELVEKVRSHVRSGDVLGLVHLAALVSVVEAEEKPWRAIDVNVKGTLNVLELARMLDVGVVVYASSAAVYGEPVYLPIDEDHPLKPVNLYGESKYVGERLVGLYSRRYGLRGVSLRYFNVYGPRMRGGPYAGVIHNFVVRLLLGDTPIIYGDGNQTRDFVYVTDVAEANIAALESGAEGVFNIGTGRGVSINELYRMLCRVVGYCPIPHYEAPRPGDVRRSVASVKRATSMLGWRPRVGLEEGLRMTVEYYKSTL